ncbi:MAG TPA: hypothetical protein VF532_17180 [Candidatus Angelobacter sp.]
MRRLWFLVVAVLAVAGYAQGPWAKKDWKQWSNEDCKRILEESPWASRWSRSDIKMANVATRTSGTQGVGSEAETGVFYVVQLRSALPIRQAVVRQALIANKFDRLDAKQQESMLKQTEDFLDRKYDDVIVVHVIYGSNVQEYNRDLAAFWQTHYPEGAVPQEALLHGPKGQKITPTRLLSPRGGAQEFELIFPRLVEGEPLLGPHDKTLGVEFASPAVGSVSAARVFVEFKVDKMVVNGQVAY